MTYPYIVLAALSLGVPGDFVSVLDDRGSMLSFYAAPGKHGPAHQIQRIKVVLFCAGGARSLPLRYVDLDVEKLLNEVRLAESTCGTRFSGGWTGGH